MSAASDSAVFDRVVRPHLDRLYRLAWRLTGARPEADDLFQDLLVKAYAKLDDLVDVDEPGAWLGRIMYNLYIDDRRRHARRRLRFVDDCDLPGNGITGLAGGEDPVAENERHEAFAILDRALAQLSEEHRLVVLLHDAEAWKITEIQELTGLPVGTIKSRLHRARARLRDILAGTGTFSPDRSCNA